MDHQGAVSKGIALTDRQRVAWLRLIRTDNVGPVTFRDLINHFGSAELALEALPELASRGGALKSVRIHPADLAEREIEQARRMGARFLGVGEPGYPLALRQIDGAPPLISVKGRLDTLTQPAIGIVGARNCSISGAKFAASLAHAFGAHGYMIVSGLARGIDAAAHRAAMTTGTVAIYAGGLDQPYPPENIGLSDEIVENGGAIVSEMPFGWEPRARDFPRRNRLISGIAMGLVVVEAALRSGSLITARMAADFGRQVFAAPGSPLDPCCEGSNNLIKEGAALVTHAEDVLSALAPVSQLDLFHTPLVSEPERMDRDPLASPPTDADRAAIVEALGPTPVEIDDIIRHTSLSAQQVYLVLLELDLAGRLHRHGSGLVSIDL